MKLVKYLFSNLISRRLSGEDEENVRKVNLTSNKEADRETVPVEEVKCLVLKGIEEEEEEEEKVEVSNQKEDEAWSID